MSTTDFLVKVTGELNPGVSNEQAAQGLSKIFNIAVSNAEKILSKPTVIKRGIDQATAEKIKKALLRVGVHSVIENPNGTTSQIDSSTSPILRKVDPTPKASPSLTKESREANNVPSEPQPGYQFKIEGQPDYAFLTVQMPANKTLRVEASAMATMDTNMVMKTKAKGGLGRLLTSESIFINEFTAENGPGEIGIAPAAPGDLAHVYLEDEVVYLQNSAFVASDMAVEVETKWQGLTKGFFSGESLFLIRCSGKGDLWFNTYGGMIMLDVDGDYVVDTGNIVAFTDGLEYKITKVGGYKSLFFSGEGFVCRFSGKGKVWIQTRTVQALTSWAYPYRPAKG